VFTACWGRVLSKYRRPWKTLWIWNKRAWKSILAALQTVSSPPSFRPLLKMAIVLVGIHLTSLHCDYVKSPCSICVTVSLKSVHLSVEKLRAGQPLPRIMLLMTLSLAVSPQQEFTSLKSQCGYSVLTGKDQTASLLFLGRAASRYAGT